MDEKAIEQLEQTVEQVKRGLSSIEGDSSPFGEVVRNMALLATLDSEILTIILQLLRQVEKLQKDVAEIKGRSGLLYDE